MVAVIFSAVLPVSLLTTVMSLWHTGADYQSDKDDVMGFMSLFMHIVSLPWTGLRENPLNLWSTLEELH